jgi:hypothetical protein
LHRSASLGPCAPRAEQRPQAAAHRRAAPSARRFGCTLRLASISFGHCRHKPLSLKGRSPPRGPALRGLSFCPVFGEGLDISLKVRVGFASERAALPPHQARSQGRQPAAPQRAAPRPSATRRLFQSLQVPQTCPCVADARCIIPAPWLASERQGPALRRRAVTSCHLRRDAAILA